MRSSPITGKPIAPSRSIKPKHTRRIIRTHHKLLKQQAQLEGALKSTPDAVSRSKIAAEIAEIQSSISSNGGIDKYQQASIAGQSSTRGGDSSKLLVSWLEDDHADLSLLEIGCLSVRNACSNAKKLFTHIERIDLNSQDPQILEQDFMARPLPSDPSEQFSVLSLSLVLNYVPTAEERGRMLYRTTQFLVDPSSTGPLLFFVLPLPCVENSRYMTEERILDILKVLGYKVIERKLAKKVVYWLLQLVKRPPPFEKLAGKFPKKLVNDGKVRNNFTIIF